MSRRAFTIVETLIYTGLFLIILLTMGAVYKIIYSTQQSAAATYAVTGDADTTIQWLRRDLEETAMSSIRTYPATGEVGMKPGLSFCSPRSYEPGKAGQLRISEYGVPLWQKNIFYGVRCKPGDNTGVLVRWESPLPANELDRLPKLVSFPTAPNEPAARILLHNVVAPGQSVPGVDSYHPSPWGGFRVQFVRRGHEVQPDTLADVNPALNPEGADGNTNLIEIGLAVVDLTTGSPNFCSLDFRVNARF